MEHAYTVQASGDSAAARRVQLQRLTLKEEQAEPALFEALDEEEDRLYEKQGKLTAQLSKELEARHTAFHPQWGQLFKAGHQNSRWAQQVADYACLYTSHATNLQYATSHTTFRALTDMMPHDRACIELHMGQDTQSAGDEPQSPSDE